MKPPASDFIDDEEECRPWRRRLTMAFSWGSTLRITLLLLLVAAVVTACFTLPIEKVFIFIYTRLEFNSRLLIFDLSICILIKLIDFDRLISPLIHILEICVLDTIVLKA